MFVRFWGTRGSIAKPGRDTLRYGGNTSCIELRTKAGTLVVIDCGTGAHGLGQRLMASPDEPKPLRGSLLISHTHWDHIHGLPFFVPLFVPGNEWDIYAPRGLSGSLRDTLSGQMQYTYFPVSLESLGASIRYHELVEGEFDIGDIRVRTRYLNHPALTLGYRLEADGVSVVYSCDHEPVSQQGDPGPQTIATRESRHVAFLAGADLVIHDAQYTPAEYANKVGWGHSTHEYAVAVCEAAGVRQLALTHHDPMRSDADIDAIVARTRQALGERASALEVVAAAEDETIALSPSERIAAPNIAAFAATAPVADAVDRHFVLTGALRAEAAEILDAAAAAEHLRVVTEHDAAALLDRATRESPSLIVLDAEAAGSDVAALAETIRHADTGERPHPPVVAIGAPAPDEARDAVTEWITWPFSEAFARTKMRGWVLRTSVRWMRAHLPRDEAARLADLHSLGILDTAPEERFDRITRIAATALDLPIALVSLIDAERQWFKSCLGLPVRETDREMAFCAHVVHDDAEVTVPDTHLDPRFADNPLVTGPPCVRFYAGVPLRSAAGRPLGTLCVIDTRPRHFDEAQMALLRDLAALVEQELTKPAEAA